MLFRQKKLEKVMIFLNKIKVVRLKTVTFVCDFYCFSPQRTKKGYQ